MDLANFNRSEFYPLKKNFNSFEIIQLINNFLVDKKIKNDFMIKDVSSTNIIKENSILFLEKNYSLKDVNSDNILIISDDLDLIKSNKFKNLITVSNLNKCLLILLNEIFYHDDAIDYYDKFNFINNSYISEYSFIHPSAKLYNNCIIGRGVRIGKNCIIKNNVVIKNSIISDNVIISDNTTIGSTGFGFDMNNKGSFNIIPHIGIVLIENGVYIGSNCAIDRAKFDFTRIGKNSMIDNLVHIAHNVRIAENACIAGQTGISGSVEIGKNLVTGGQVGFAGHISIGDNVVVAGKSGVTKNISSNSIVAGFPATDIKKWKRQIIKQKKDGY